MQNYIENFEFNYLLLPIKRINDNTIIFSTEEIPFEFYIPEIKHYIDLKRENSGSEKIKEQIIDSIYNSSPEYNLFNILDISNKDNLYIDFSNLLSPKNKKEKLNKISNIKNFIEKYGYIFPFSVDELSNPYIERNFSEIENEVKILNTILSIQKALDSNLEINTSLPSLENFDLVLDRFPILKLGLDYTFKESLTINSDKMLKEIVDIFKRCIEIVVNDNIKNCKIKFSNNSIPTQKFICDSLLELLYLQFVTDISNSNIRIGKCEFCGKLVKLKKDKKYNHIFCKLTNAEKKDKFKDRSPCEINYNMAEYRKRKKKEEGR